MIIRRRFFRTLLAGLFAGALLPIVGRAETAAQKRKRHGDASPSPSPEPSASPALGEDPAATPAETPAAKPDAARLRLWKTSDMPDQLIQLKLTPQGKPGAKPISPFEIEAGTYQISNYVEVPDGPMIAEFSAPGQRAISLPLNLSARGQSTVLVRLNGGNLSAEWIDDTPDPTDSGCEFDVYNLLPASGDIQVTFGTILTLHLTAVRSSARLAGIKRGNYHVAINGTDGSGKNFLWNTDADFRQFRKAALLIFGDAYGRIRPRIVPA